MTVDRRRYSRQIRLSEIGEAGQAKLCTAKVSLGAAGFARTIEERYTRAAGMQVTIAAQTVDSSVEADDVANLGLRDASAREVAEGALRALALVNAALGLERRGGA